MISLEIVDIYEFGMFSGVHSTGRWEYFSAATSKLFARLLIVTYWLFHLLLEGHVQLYLQKYLSLKI